jgi:hypothetical protein
LRISGESASTLRICAGLGFEVTLDLVEARRYTHLVAEEGSTEDGGLCYMHLAVVEGWRKWKQGILFTKMV